MEVDTPCREWFGGRHRKGYGYRAVDGRTTWLHRWIWEQIYGPVPPGMVVRHRCDNPPCFRLDHLLLGTNADNVADRVARGRSAMLKGSMNGAARLDEEKVADIRVRLGAGETQWAVARLYGVHQRTIWRILHGESWTHVRRPL